MSTLTGRQPKDTYKDLLQVSNSNMGVDTTVRTVEDGEGTASALQLSTTKVNINGTPQIGGVDMTATAGQLNQLAGVTPGTTTASKALVVDANKRLDELVLGTLKLGAGAGTAVTATAAEINVLAASGVSQVELQALDRSQKCTFFDDFLGDLIADEWTALAGTDPQCVAPAVNAGQAGGLARMTTGDAGTNMATDGVSLVLGLNWLPSKGGLVCEIGIVFRSIANIELFLGLTDTIALEMPFLTNSTANATDACGFFMDTANNDTLYAVAVENNTVRTAVVASMAPQLDTVFVCRIEVNSAGNAAFYVAGTLVTTIVDAVTPSVALTPVVCARALTTTSKNLDIDYVYVQQNR